jgi:hypothetical protein
VAKTYLVFTSTDAGTLGWTNGTRGKEEGEEEKERRKRK